MWNGCSPDYLDYDSHQPMLAVADGRCSPTRSRWGRLLLASGRSRQVQAYPISDIRWQEKTCHHPLPKHLSAMQVLKTQEPASLHTDQKVRDGEWKGALCGGITRRERLFKAKMTGQLADYPLTSAFLAQWSGVAP